MQSMIGRRSIQIITQKDYSYLRFKDPQGRVYKALISQLEQQARSATEQYEKKQRQAEGQSIACGANLQMSGNKRITFISTPSNLSQLDEVTIVPYLRYD